MRKKHFVLGILLLALMSCMETQNLRSTGEPLAEVNIENVQVENGILVMDGENLKNIKSVKVMQDGVERELNLVINDDGQVRLSAVDTAIELISGAMSLIITNAYGQDSFHPITIKIPEKSLSLDKFSHMGAGDGDILIFNQETEKWEPKPYSAGSAGLSYQGIWDASAEVGPSENPDQGDFWIVSKSGEFQLGNNNRFISGDWVIFDGYKWSRVPGSFQVSTFNGRSGTVKPRSGDYSWSMIEKTNSSLFDLGDVSGNVDDLSEGMILKWDGSKWAPSEMAEVSSEGSNDNSQLIGQIEALSENTLSNEGGTLSGDINMSENNITNVGTVDGVDIQALNIKAISTQTLAQDNKAELAGKEKKITPGLPNQFLRGDKTWQTLDTDTLVEGENNLYFTDQRVMDTAISGYSRGNTEFIEDGDTFLEALGKLEALAIAGGGSGGGGTITSVNAGEGFIGGGSSGVVTLDANVDGTSIEIANDAIGIKNGGVTSTKLSVNSVDSSKIINGSVSGDDIASRTITDANISESANIDQGKIKSLQTDLASKANLSGATFQGNISLSNNRIENLANPLADKDAANKNYVDTQVSNAASPLGESITSNEIENETIVDADISSSADIAQSKIRNLQSDLSSKVSKGGDTLSGDLNLDGNKVLGLAEPTVDSEAANKAYVDTQIANANSNGPGAESVGSEEIIDDSIVNEDIAANAAISQSKIEGLSTSLSELLPKTGGTLEGSLTVDENVIINKNLIGGIGARTTVGTLDWNHSSNTRSGSSATLLGGSATNGPGVGNYFHPFNFEYQTRSGNGNTTQFAIPYGNSSSMDQGIRYRGRYAGSWTQWMKVLSENTNGDVGIGLSGTTQPTEKLEVGGNIKANKIILTGTPTASTHAATKGYVDSVAGVSVNSVDSSHIIDGAIVNADISDSAAISQSKILGLSDSLDDKLSLSNGGTINGVVNTSNNVNINGDLQVGENVSLGGNVDVEGHLYSNDKATFYDTVEIEDDLILSDSRVRGLASPIELTDAANKEYVDSKVTELDSNLKKRRSTTFDVGNSDWSHLNYGTTNSNIAYSAAHEGLVITNAKTITLDTKIPVDGHSTYRVEMTAKRLSGSGGLYVGSVALDGDYNVLQTDNASAYNYFLAINMSFETGVEKKIVGYISGYNAVNESVHNKLDPGAQFFDIKILANYQGTGDFLIKSIHVEKVEELFADKDGNVGVGIKNPSEKLDVAGNIKANKVTINNAPVLDTDAATKGYVDAQVSAELSVNSVDSTHVLDGSITNEDISASAAISQSKVDGLETSLSGLLPLSGGTMSGNLSVTSHHPRLQLSGSSSGYVNAAVILEATQSASRGAGIFMQNTVSETEWYVGRGYGGLGDSLVFARKETASHIDQTADGSNVLARFNSSGQLIFGSNVAITNNNQATTKAYVDAQVASVSGQNSVGSFEIIDGSIVDADIGSISQNKITGLSSALGAKLNLKGGVMTGDIGLGSNNINNVGVLNTSELDLGDDKAYENIRVKTGDGIDGYNGVVEILPKTVPGSGIAYQATMFKNTGKRSGVNQHDVLFEGNVGVGITSRKPTAKLEVIGNIKADQVIINNAPTLGTDGANKAYVDSEIAAVVSSGTSSNSITSAHIVDSTIVDADILSLSQSKITGLSSSLDGKVDINGDTLNGSLNMNGNDITEVSTLHLAGTGSAAPRLTLGGNHSEPGSYPNKVSLWQGGANNYFGFGVSSGDLDYFTQSNHKFHVGYSGTPGSQAMMIAHTGNVGIGGNSDGERLSVSGNVKSNYVILNNLVPINDSHATSKKYVDDQLAIVASSGLSSESVNSNHIVDGTIVDDDIDSITQGKVTGLVDALGDLLPITGGTLAGNLDLNNNTITNISTPVNNGDASNKEYVDSQVSQLSTDLRKSKSTTFDVGNNDWTHLTYGGSESNMTHSPDHQGLKFSGRHTVNLDMKMPVDGKSTYRVELTAKRISGDGGLYVGARSLDANYNTLSTDNATAYNYFLAANMQFAEGEEKTVVNYISGYNLPTGNAPHKFDPGAQYFDLIMLVNYQGSGEFVIKSINVERVEEVFTNVAGNVGIGLKNASEKLEVSGNVKANNYIITGSPTAATHAATKGYVDAQVSAGLSANSVDSTHVLDGSITNEDISASAAISQSKVDGLETSLSGLLPLSGGTMSGHLSVTNGQPRVTLTGSGTGYVNASVNLVSTQSAARGSGMFMHNTASSTEWYFGRGYGVYGDSMVFSRKGTAAHDDHTAHGDNVLAYFDNAGRLLFNNNSITLGNQATTKDYVDAQVAAVSVNGTQITDNSITDADISLSANISQDKIEDLGASLDSKLDLIGGTMEGNIDLDGNNLSNASVVDADTLNADLINTGGSSKIGNEFINVAEARFNSNPGYGFKIKTNLPFANSNHMPIVNVKGYAYGTGKTINLQMSWYIYSNEFRNTRVSSSGDWAPTVQLANEDNKVVIFINDATYYSRFNVSVIRTFDANIDSRYKDWSIVDEAISGTHVADMVFSNTFRDVRVLGSLNVSGKEILGVADPTTDGAAANKSYVDSQISAIDTNGLVGASIDSSEIENDSIVNEDISTAAAIDQSKISGLVSDLGDKLDKNGGDITGGFQINLDGNVTLKTTDTEWLYTNYYDSNNVRRSWVGLDRDLDTFTMHGENGTTKFLLSGMNATFNQSLNVNENLNLVGADSKFTMKTTDGSWLVSEYYDDLNARRAWFGLDADLDTFTFLGENGTDKFRVIDMDTTIDENLFVGTDLGVTGHGTFGGDVQVDGSFEADTGNFTGAVNVGGDVIVQGNGQFTDLESGGDFYVQGTSIVQGDHEVRGDSDHLGTLNVSLNANVTGDVYATAYYYTSDKRLKENIRSISGLEQIKKLNGVRFSWISNGRDEIGFIAQEVEEVFPELVTLRADGYKSVNYSGIISPLVEAVKDLDSKDSELEVRIKSLEETVDRQSELLREQSEKIELLIKALGK